MSRSRKAVDEISGSRIKRLRKVAASSRRYTREEKAALRHMQAVLDWRSAEKF